MKRTLNTTALQIIMGISMLVLVLQLGNMQFNLANKYKEAGKNPNTSDIYTNPDRGVIYDRNGTQLVKNEPRYAIAVTRQDLPTDKDMYITLAYLPADNPARSAFYTNLAKTLARPTLTANAISQLIAAADPKRPLRPILIATDLSDKEQATIAKAYPPAPSTAVWLAPAKQRVFDGLGAILNAPIVVYIVPEQLPRSGDSNEAAPDLNSWRTVFSNTATLLAPLGGPNANTISDTLKQEIAPDRPLLIFSGLTDEVAENFRRNASALTGINVGSELAYNYLRNYSAVGLSPVIVKSNVSYEVARQVDTKSRDLPGSSTTTDPVRVYTDGPLYSDILGYVGLVKQSNLQANPTPDPAHPEEPYIPTYLDNDKIGKMGIEATMDKALRGTKGVREVELKGDQPGNKIGELPPVRGNNLYLTIDSGLQKAATASLQKYIQQSGVTAGAAIVEDVRSGQILAMVSLPTYDNNLFTNNISEADWAKLNDPNLTPMLNRAIAGNYPPGSTFKIIMAAAGLQSGVIDQNKTYNCPGIIRVPYTADNTKFNNYYDWKLSGHGNLNVIQAIGDSCDVFFYNLGGPKQDSGDGQYTRYLPINSNNPVYFDGLGIERINQFATAFGLSQITGIELVGEDSGLIPDRQWKLDNFNDDWSLGDTLISSIGQGYDLVTPLQLVNATAAIANGGTLYQPTLVYQIRDGEGKNVVQGFQPKVIRQVPVTAPNLAIVRQGMRIAVSGGMGVYGTARRTDYKSLAVAGKTGTAEFGEPNPKTGFRSSHAWFTSFAPYDNPQIAVTVFIQGGAGNGQVNSRQLEGGIAAVPVAADIYKYYFNLNETPGQK